MSRELRILHLADTHIGAALPSRPRVDRARRGDDLIASYRAALDRADEHEVDLVLHAGDVFDRPDPSGPALAAATAPLLDLASRGIPVVVIPGNHERSVLPASLLLQHPRIHVLDRPRTLSLKIRGQRVSVTGLPCVRRGVANCFAERLAESDWRRNRGDCHLLVLHQTLDSATCGPIGYRFRSGVDVLDRDQVPGGFDYVALGHIHRHQMLAPPSNAGLPLVYAGSTDRISFAERDEPKGCVLIRERGGRLVPTFLEHPVRAMCVVPIDVTDLTRDGIIAAVHEGVAQLPDQATVAIRLSGSARPRTLARLRLAQRIAAVRPDLLVRISMQHVEMRAAERGPTVADGDPLATLPAVVGPPVEVARDDLRDLPDQCGTYLLRDARGTVIYVGKSKRVRTRIRGHLRPSSGSNLYTGWTDKIQAALVRPAAGELEALLAEAILVAHLRPAFNRQMRMWSRYCYLTEDPERFRQLQVCRDRAPDRLVCHGPFRSRWSAEAIARELAESLQLAACPAEQPGLPLLNGMAAGMLCQRFYDRQCGGPCAGRITSADYAARIETRRALLHGAPEAEALVLAAEASLPETPPEQADPVERQARRRAETLRLAFDTGRLHRRALELRGGLLLLPAGAPGCVAAVILRSPIPRMQRLALERPPLRRVLAGLGSPPDGPLAKQELDLYATILRTLDSDPQAGLAWSASAARTLGPEGVRRAVESHRPEWFRVGTPGV